MLLLDVGSQSESSGSNPRAAYSRARAPSPELEPVAAFEDRRPVSSAWPQLDEPHQQHAMHQQGAKGGYDRQPWSSSSDDMSLLPGVAGGCWDGTAGGGGPETVAVSGRKTSKADEAAEPIVSGDRRDASVSLRVPMLKERLELELNLRREGLRFLMMVILMACFAYKCHLGAMPEQQNDSQTTVMVELGLSRVSRVTSTPSAFALMMNVSNTTRALSPLSWNYITGKRSHGLVGKTRRFLHGPVGLPMEHHPVLSSQWNIHFYLGLDRPFEESPRQRLIIRQHTPSGDLDLTCWALYSQGMFQYRLVYGGHNLDTGQAELSFTFDPSSTVTNPAQLNMVALVVNTTHASVMLQDAGPHHTTRDGSQSYHMPGVVTLPFSPGTVPTDCLGGAFDIGDLGLQLSRFEFHPGPLTPSMFHEVEEAGQPAAHLAAGIRVPDAPAKLDEQNGKSLGSSEIKQLVHQSSQDILAVVKLAGSMAYDSSTLANATSQTLASLPKRDLLGSSGVDQIPFDAVLPGGDDLMLLAPGATEPDNLSISQSLTAAFNTLAQAGSHSFTLAWWAKAGPGFKLQFSAWDSFEELVVTSSASGLEKLRVVYLQGEGLPEAGGWVVQMNGSPSCEGREDEALCMRSPGLWCQAPQGGAYQGIRRHIALRVSHGGQAKSRIDLLLDGVQLCGAWFDGDGDLLPTASTNQPVAAVFGRLDGESSPFAGSAFTDGMEVRDVRLYSESLPDLQLEALAHDPEVVECLDLEVVMDSHQYTSEFGQTCADLSEVSDSGDGPAPGGCRLESALTNCPVSCMHELVPMCYDGMARVGSAEKTSSPLNDVLVGMLSDPVLGDELLADAGQPSAGYWDALPASGVEFAGGEAFNSWQSLFGMADKLPHAMLLSSRSIVPQEHVWIASSNSSDPGWCPGLDLSAELFGGLCVADLHWEHLRDFAAQTGVKAEELNIALDYDSSLVARSSSYTLYFWAKIEEDESLDNLSLAGTDSSNNICFHISGPQATLIRHGAVSGGMAGAEAMAVARHADDLKLRDPWVFLALDVNVEKGTFAFAVNEDVTKLSVEGLAEGEWGCDSLDYVLNIGRDAIMTPIRVSRLPLQPGALQRLYLTTRPAVKALVGPSLSQLGRLETHPLRRRRYTNAIVSLSPPLLLQERLQAGSADCEDEVITAVNDGLLPSLGHVCAYPYSCEMEPEESIVEAVCKNDAQEDDISTTELFFGRLPHTFQGKALYPDFAWGLEADVIVRNGVNIYPQEEYIDSHTTFTELLLTLFAPQTQVITLAEVRFGLEKSRVRGKVFIHQLKLMSPDELAAWMAATIASLAAAFICALLALPAAFQELKVHTKRWIPKRLTARPARLIASGQRRLSSSVSQLTGSFGKSKWEFNNPTSYTSGSTQPNLMDVVFYSTLMCVLGYEIWFKIHETKELKEVLGHIGSIPWSDTEMSFREKLEDYLYDLSNLQGFVGSEKAWATVDYLFLLLSIGRLLVYMRIHPKIASITTTFGRIGFEMLNFMFTFSIIFTFLAVTAYIRFGSQVEGFRTVGSAVAAQFSLLVTGEVGAASADPLFAIYMLSFVLLCTLAMLNFFLAIVVNGYSEVQQETLDNKVARGFGKDIGGELADVGRYALRLWPSKLFILQALSSRYPRAFQNGNHPADELHGGEPEDSISREEFVGLLEQTMVLRPKAGRLLPRVDGEQGRQDVRVKAGEVFDYLSRLDFLLVSEKANQLAQTAAQ